MRASMTLFFRTEYVLVIRDGGGRRAESSGTRSVLIVGIRDKPRVKGIVLCGTASTRWWVLMGGEGRGVARFSGR